MTHNKIVTGLIGFVILFTSFITVDYIGSDVVPTTVVVLDKLYEPSRTEIKTTTNSNGDLSTYTNYIPEKYKLIVKEVDENSYSPNVSRNKNEIMTVQVDLEKYATVDKEDITVVDIYYGWITGMKYN